MTGGKVRVIYGATSNGGTVRDVEINISGSAKTNSVHGGGVGSVTGDVRINISGGEIAKSVVGGSPKNNSVHNTFITITGGKIGFVIGGGTDNSPVTGNTDINISGNTEVKEVIGGGFLNSNVQGNTSINISDSVKVKKIYGGGFETSNVTGNTTINISGNVQTEDIYGGGKDNSIVQGNADINIIGGNVSGAVYGGGADNTGSVNGKKMGLIEVPTNFNTDSFTELIGKDINSDWNIKGQTTLKVGGKIIIEQGKTLRIPNGATLTLNGSIENNGTLKLEGTLDGQGTLNGTGKFQTVKDHLTADDISIQQEYKYTGEEITPVHSINKKTQVLGIDFEISNWKFKATNPSVVKELGNYTLIYEKENTNVQITKSFKVVQATQEGTVRLSQEDKNHDNKINAGDILSVDLSTLRPKGGTPSYSWKRKKGNEEKTIGTEATYKIKPEDEGTQIYCVVSFSGNTEGKLTTNKLQISKPSKPLTPLTPATPSQKNKNSITILPLLEPKNETLTDSKLKIKKYSKRYFDFSLKTLKKTMNKSNHNTLVSPLSTMYAMGMITNGAKNDTLKEMEKTIGMSKKEINEYLNAYISFLALDKSNSKDKVQFHFANSIWIKDDKNFELKQDFLNKNSDIYKFGLYETNFNSSALNKMNSWINKNTKGTIKRVVDKVEKDAVMYLINALGFEGKWENVYNKEDIKNEMFTTYSGNKKTVKMMHSKENKYISDKNTAGFIKTYDGGNYAFVALLPDKNTDTKDYVESLNFKKVKKLLSNVESKTVHAVLPAFKSDSKLELNATLKKMGMKAAFDSSKADFGEIGKTKDGKNLFINKILHKTHIAVDELGSKAGVVAAVNMTDKSMSKEKIKKVKLDRPFVYMIIDTKTNTPVFIGTVMEIGK